MKRVFVAKKGTKFFFFTYIPLVSLIGVLIGYCAFVTAEVLAPEARIKIGVSIPLSGESAIYGDEMKQFFDFANLELAQNKYELIFEDDRCDGKSAVNVAQKFSNIDKIKYVIGFACSNALLASAKEYAKKDIIAIATYASSPKIKDAGVHVYRTCPSDAIAGKLLGEHIAKQKIPVVGSISDQTDYTQDMISAVIASAKEYNVAVLNEDYLPGTTDFRSILLRLRQKAPNSLFINPQAENTFGVIVDQAHQLDWYPKIYGAYWPGSPTLLARKKGALKGVEFVDTPALSDLLVADGQKILQRFKEWGGTINSTESNFVTSFEAFRAIHQAIQSNEDIKTYFNKTTFDGLFGKWSFDSDGEIQGIGFALKRIENDKPINIQ